MDLLKDLQPILLLAFAAGGSWYGVKAGLNGARRDIAEIRADVKTIVQSDAAQNTRLSVLETEVKNQAGWLRDVAKTADEAWERREARRP